MNYEKIKDNVIKSLNEAELEHVTGGSTISFKKLGFSVASASIVSASIISCLYLATKIITDAKRDAYANSLRSIRVVEMDVANQINDTIAKARHDNESKANIVIRTDLPSNMTGDFEYTINLTL